MSRFGAALKARSRRRGATVGQATAVMFGAVLVLALGLLASAAHAVAIVTVMPDPSFTTPGSGFDGEINSVAVQPDGKVVVGGAFTSFNGTARNGIARLNADGTLDNGFNPGEGTSGGDLGNSDVLSVAVQLDGKVVAGGLFTSFDGVQREFIARLNSNGSLDTGFNPGGGFDRYVSSVAVQLDGKVVAGGRFTSFDGVPRAFIARLNPDGSLDTGFNPGGGFDRYVSSVAVQPDGKVIAGGGFTSFGGVTRRAIARLNSDASLDSGFNPGGGFGGPVDSVAVQPDAKVIAGGGFTSFGGAARKGIARLNSDGSLDSGFNPGGGFDHVVLSVAAQRDGKVIVGGAFEFFGGAARNRIARLNSDGSLDTGFNPGSGFNHYVRSVAVQPNGRIIAAGPFTTFNGTGAHRITALLATPSAPTGLAATPGNARATVAFTASAVTGGAAITNYRYTLSADNGATWTAWTALNPADATSPVTIPGLTNGTAYRVKLRAVNAVGVGAESAASAPFTPRTVPSAPTISTATPADMSATVAFSAPAMTGGAAITNYKYSIDDGATWTTRSPASTTSPVLIPALANGTAYRVRLRAVNAAGDGVMSAPVVVTPLAPGSLLFVPVPPARVLDTRPPAGAGPLAATESREVSVARGDAGEVVPAGAVAVAYNLAVPTPAAAGHIRVQPGDAVSLTTASAVNFLARETIANGLTAKISPTRTLKLYNGSSGPADAVVDIVGYFVPAASASDQQLSSGRFTAITPTRVYSSDVNGGATGSTQTATVDLSSALPAGASAVAYNITVVNPAAPGHVRVYPADQLRPESSTINFIAGDRVANGTVVKVSPERRINVYNGSSAPVNFLIDVVGYYSATGTFFHAIDPVRTLSTRPGDGGAGPIGPDSQRTLEIWHPQTDPQSEVVPTGATAIAYNVTAVATGSPGHLRVWPAHQTKPGASTLNWPADGYTRANGTAVAISPTRHVAVYSSATTPTNVLIDVNGYYRP